MSASRPLVGLQVRLTRRSGVVWLVVLAAMAVTVVRSFDSLYPTAPQRAVLAQQFGANLGLQAIYGHAFDLTTTGGFTAWRVGGTVGIIVMLWGMFSIVRLTRTEEQTGRQDLVAAGGITPRRILVGAVGVCAAWQLLDGAVLALALRGVGLPWRGSAVLAGTLAALGMTGVAIGALCAQVWPTRGRALGRGGIAIGAATLVRIVADASASRRWLRWFSPNGWAEETRAFTAGERLWPAALLVVLVALLLGAAFAIVARRDVGAALRADRDAGPSVGRLRGAVGLEARLVARSAAGWLVALAVVGVVTGLLASDIADFARRTPAESAAVRRFGVEELSSPEGWIGLMFGLVVIVLIAVFAARTVGAAADAETEGIADHLLVQPLTRARWVAVQAGTAVVAAALVALATGVTAWLSMIGKPDAVALGRALGAGANLVPLAVCVIGVGTLVRAVAPRLAGAAALGLVIGGYLVEFLGAIVRAPRWVRDLSPFHHVSPYPAAPVHVLALAVLGAIGVASLLAALVAVNRRDIVSR